MSDFTDIMLPITCPVCQHAWEIDAPALPWRALPAFKREMCSSCHAMLRICIQEKDGHLNMSIDTRNGKGMPQQKRRDIVEYRIARQMGTVAKRMGLSFRILHRSEDGLPKGKVEVEVIAIDREALDAFDQAMSEASEADVLRPWDVPDALHVANLELCKELFELSEWFDCYFDWWIDLQEQTCTVLRDVSRDGASVAWSIQTRLYPAYDLGYLLRKLPNDALQSRKLLLVFGWDDERWRAGYYSDYSKWGMYKEADTPEDAACRLAICLFRLGVLKRSEQ